MSNNHLYCPSCQGFYLIDQVTGQKIRLGCKRYDCEYCGKIKALKLKKALNKYLSTFKFVRLFTYTVRTTLFPNPKVWNKLSSEVWRRFLNNIRRNPNLTNKQKSFQYVKVAEFTQRGFIHFHVVQSEYIQWEYVYRAWNEAIAIVIGRNLVWSDNRIINQDTLGAVNIKGIENSKHASNYLVKYLVKSAKDISTRSKQIAGVERTRVRLWSKSGRIAFFQKKHTVHAWYFIKVTAEEDQDLLNLYLLDITSQNLAEKITKANKLEPYILKNSLLN